MSWYNEPRRHALSAKGIKTAIEGKPINKVKSHSICMKCGGEVWKEEGMLPFCRECGYIQDQKAAAKEHEEEMKEFDYMQSIRYKKEEEIEKEISDRGLKFFSVLHSKDYPDDAKTFIIEKTQEARVLAKNEADAKKQVKNAFKTGVIEVTKIDDDDEINELKQKLLKQELEKIDPDYMW